MDLINIWTLSWSEQLSARISPISIHAFYGRDFHHPHLRGGTVRDWPLNIFSDAHAAAELPTLRSIAAAEIHNLVFTADYSVVPALKTTTLPASLELPPLGQ